MAFEQCTDIPNRQDLATFNTQTSVAAYEMEFRGWHDFWRGQLLDGKDEGRLAMAIQLYPLLNAAVWIHLDEEGCYKTEPMELIIPDPEVERFDALYKRPPVLDVWPSGLIGEQDRRRAFGAMGVAELLHRLTETEEATVDAKEQGDVDLLLDVEEEPTPTSVERVHTTVQEARRLLGTKEIHGWHRDGDLLVLVMPSEPTDELRAHLLADGVEADFKSMVQIIPVYAARTIGSVATRSVHSGQQN
jgi:hypothetical protein